MILLHRPFIPRHRDGQVFVSNVHHKRATEHANQLVDLLARFAAGAYIDKVSFLLLLRSPNLHPRIRYEQLRSFVCTPAVARWLSPPKSTIYFPADNVYPQLPPNDAYLIFTAAVIQVFNFCANEPALRDAARPRLEKCIEWLRVIL